MKEEEKVIQKYRGYNKDENYNREIEQARTKDHASYGSSSPAPAHPAQPNPVLDAISDKCYYVVCCGCCETDSREYDPDNQSSCTIL